MLDSCGTVDTPEKYWALRISTHSSQDDVHMYSKHPVSREGYIHTTEIASMPYWMFLLFNVGELETIHPFQDLSELGYLEEIPWARFVDILGNNPTMENATL